MLTRIVLRLYSVLGGSRWLRTPVLERLYLASFFLYKRFVEDPFAALAKRRPELFSGGHILDVGANVGYTATVFAAALTPGFQVIAFEPEPLNFRTMRRLLQRRRLSDKVQAVQAAVGAESGEVHLAVNPRHPGDHRVTSLEEPGRTVRVPMVTVDEYVEAHALTGVRFVKIDVQGMELAVSRGMERLLATSPRVVVAFEYAEDQTQESKALISFYAQRGFALHLLTSRGEVLPLTAEGIGREWLRRGYGNVLAVRGERI